MCSLSGHEGHRRGQSGPLGLLLVLAIVITATTLIVVLAAGSISGTQGTLDTERAEKTMTQLDSQAALVALGNSGVQRVDLSTAGGSSYEVRNDTGRMTLSYRNQTTGAQTVVFSERMGSIVYESDSGSIIAYQGGGVWRSDGDGNAVMVSPPEFHYRGQTLTLPLVTVGSSGTVGNRAVISRENTTRYFPNTTKNPGYRNPLENARVEVTVTSDYYRAWGEYFETRTDGEVEYDHANDTVRLALVAPLQNTRITSATASLSASGSFEINGAAGNFCGSEIYTNSYNSSGTSDDYCDQLSSGDVGNNGTIVYGNDVEIDGGSGGGDIRGDVISGASVLVGNGGGKPYVNGSISYTDNCNDCASRITDPDGSVNRISGVDQAPAIDGIILTQVEETSTSNDNGNESAISGNSINSGSVEVSDGRYYLTEVDVAGSETVTFNTTDGDIYLAVEENVELADNARIEVVGDGSVFVYVRGAGGNTNQLYMGSDSEITNAGDDAEQFRVFGQSNFTATIGSGAGGNLAKYVGVVYAPPGTSGTGTVSLDGGVVYGGLLTGTTSIDSGNGGSIHYDEALRTQRVLEQDESIVRVTYIHASTNEIRVEDG